MTISWPFATSWFHVKQPAWWDPPSHDRERRPIDSVVVVGSIGVKQGPAYACPDSVLAALRPTGQRSLLTSITNEAGWCRATPRTCDRRAVRRSVDECFT